MNLIDHIRKDREELARVVKKHRGIRKLVEDLYPDKAHFLYELLQNAEDAGAHHVRFELGPDQLVFEHDGSRVFEERDVWGITDIGEGTKEEDEATIGKFGIGFKAVFGYTESPKIWSPGYSFEIKELFLPYELDPPGDLGGRTRFQFPFNNSQKPPATAYREILEGLQALPAQTLLFLRNIHSLEWSCDNGQCASLRRQEDGHRTFIQKHRGDDLLEEASFLVFTRELPGHARQFVALAYQLEPRKEEDAGAPRTNLARKFRIVPAERGTVSVYFVAEKENSNLRFHLHAPFVTGLDRASVKDVEANLELHQALAALAAESLQTIQEDGLLDMAFLAVPPNDQDDLGEAYAGIRTAIVEACQEHELLPTDEGRHATAGSLLSGPSLIRNVVTRRELPFFTGEEGLRWARGTKTHTREYYFLKTAGVQEWSWDDLDEAIDDHFYQPYSMDLQWLDERPATWLQKLYVLLAEGFQKDLLESPDSCRIVRCTCDGETAYLSPAQCYLPRRGFPKIPQVSRTLLRDGEGRLGEKTRDALTSLGVREIGAEEQIRTILKEHYDPDREEPGPPLEEHLHILHMEAFIGFHGETGDASLFAGHALFYDEDRTLQESSSLYLDHPFASTGLADIYQHPRLQKARRQIPWQRYAELDGFEAFALACGVQNTIEIRQAPAFEHPRYKSHLHSAGNQTDYCIDEDFTIPHLPEILALQSIEANLRIWQCLCAAAVDAMEARYQPNKRTDLKTDRSTLCIELSEATWIPDYHGDLHKPQDLIESQLHPDFKYRNAHGWLDAIGLGEEARKQTQEYKQLQESSQQLGIPPDLVREFQGLTDNDRDEMAEAFLQSIKQRKLANLKEDGDHAYHHALEQGFSDTPAPGGTAVPSTGIGGDAPNPGRRRSQVAEEISEAQARGDAEAAVAGSRVKWRPRNQEARTSLQQWYGGRCQICHKPPFAKKNGEPYFEGVYLVSRTHAEWIDRVGNVLCLCPLHSAQFLHGPKTLDVPVAEQMADDDATAIRLRLCGQDVEITYVQKHRIDLQEMLKASMAPG